MATKKTTTKTTAAKKPVELQAEAQVEAAAEAVKETVQATVESVETVQKAVQANTEAAAEAFNKAATEGYEQAVAATRKQVEQASKALFNGSYGDYGKFGGDFAAAGKDNVEAVVQSGSIVVKGMEALGQELMAFTKAQVEGNVAATKALFGVKSFDEAVKLQGDFARKSFDTAVAEGTKLTEMSVKVANDAVAPIQARVDATVKQIMKQSAV